MFNFQRLAVVLVGVAIAWMLAHQHPFHAQTPPNFQGRYIAEAQHFVVGGVSLPRHAESLALSNDGTLIATSNIDQTWFSQSETGYHQSALSLGQFDQMT